LQSPASLVDDGSRYCCNLSHIAAWRRLIESGQERALILEDDVVLSRSLPAFLAAISTRRLAISVIRIEQFGDRSNHFLRADMPVLPGFCLRQALSHDIGAAGYIIDRNAATWLMGEPSLHTALIDDFLFTPFSRVGRRLDVRYADPALCMQVDTSNPQVGHSSLNGPEDAVHKRARKQYRLVKFSRHLEVWFARDIPQAMREAFARRAHRAVRLRLTFKP
jgi:GR25 family glycosyltransferase involved in LPS biosynthesis